MQKLEASEVQEWKRINLKALKAACLKNNKKTNVAGAKWTGRKLGDEIREVTGNQITQGFRNHCPNTGFSSK